MNIVVWYCRPRPCRVVIDNVAVRQRANDWLRLQMRLWSHRDVGSQGRRKRPP